VSINVSIKGYQGDTPRNIKGVLKMELKKLNEHKYAKCAMFKRYVLLNGMDFDGIEWGFMSYSTRVIIVRGSRVMFTGYYSRTTSRQLTWWLNEYGDRLKGLDKKTLDIMDREMLAYDFETGELTPLTHDELRERKGERAMAFNYGYGW
jgi:hypothetical protein